MLNPKESAITIVAIISIIITTFIVLLRLWVRKYYVRNIGVEDWVAIVALIFLYGTTTITIVVDIRGGLGQQLLATPPWQISEMLKMTYIHLLLNPWTITLVRASILLFYRRLAGVANRSVHRATTVLLWGSIVYIAVNLGLVLGMCEKKSDFWDPVNRAIACGDRKIHFLNTASICTSILMDLLVLVLPLRMIWNTKMARWNRMVVLGLLLLGFSAVAVTIFRVIYWETENDPIDFSIAWNALPYSYWIPCQLEGTVSLSAASVPMLRPLVSRSGVATSTGRSNRTPSHSGGHSSSFKSRSKVRRHSFDETDTIELVAQSRTGASAENLEDSRRTRG